MDISRRHETSGSETKDLICSRASSISCLFVSAYLYQFLYVWTVCDKKGTLSLGKPNLLWWGISISASVLEGNTSSRFLYKHPLKDHLAQMTVLARCTEIQETHGGCLPTGARFYHVVLYYLWWKRAMSEWYAIEESTWFWESWWPYLHF